MSQLQVESQPSNQSVVMDTSHTSSMNHTLPSLQGTPIIPLCLRRKQQANELGFCAIHVASDRSSSNPCMFAESWIVFGGGLRSELLHMTYHHVLLQV